MARTVESAFDEYLTWLTPTDTESEAAKNHRASIYQCLLESFGIASFYRCGSFGNGTSVSGFSDVDYIAAMPHGANELDSNQLLEKVRRVLATRFPNTPVEVDAPAIALQFGVDAKENTEVVPGQFYGATHGTHRVYHIADGQGYWYQTCPPAHKEHIRLLDERCGYRVRPIIRFLKAWKYRNNIPISSFFLEMFVALYANSQNLSSLSYGTYWMFDWLKQSFVGISDPVGISGTIWPCRTEEHRRRCCNALLGASRHAENAVRYANAGYTKSAIDEWKHVFNGYFPSFTT